MLSLVLFEMIGPTNAFTPSRLTFLKRKHNASACDLCQATYVWEGRVKPCGVTRFTT